MVRRERMETDMLTSVKRSCDDDFNIRQKQVSKQRMFPEHRVVVQWFRSGRGTAAGLQTHAAKNGETHRAGDTRDVFSEMIKQIDGNQQNINQPDLAGTDRTFVPSSTLTETTFWATE